MIHHQDIQSENKPLGLLEYGAQLSQATNCSRHTDFPPCTKKDKLHSYYPTAAHYRMMWRIME